MRNRKLFNRIIYAILVILSFSSIVFGKSVYVISRHSDSTVQAYDTVEDKIVFQEQFDQFPNNGYGAIDLAINEIDDILFASYDGANVIEIIDAKTMDQLDSETIPGGTFNEMAGIEYCHEYNWLLAAERYQTNIRVFNYDSADQTFISNTEVALPNLSGGILGICLDEEEMRL